MDISVYLKAAVAGIPIMFVVLCMVQLFKMFKRRDGTQLITGNWLTLISLVWGFLIGLGYMVLASRPPTTPDWWVSYVYWFTASLYGIGLGLLAAVFYNILKDTLSSTVNKLLSAEIGASDKQVK